MQRLENRSAMDEYPDEITTYAVILLYHVARHH